MKELLKGVVLTAGGVLLAGTGVWFAVDAGRFLQHAELTPGTVVDVISKRGSRGMRVYHPVVRFQTDSGTSVEFTGGMIPRQWLFEPGDDVVVAYQRANPPDARIRSFWTLWFLPLVAAVFGAACVFAGWHTFRHRVSGTR